jgi:PRC-barrel domain
MKRSLIVCSMLVALTAPAAAQAPSTTTPPTSATNTAATTGEWRGSKLLGLNVYNDQNEKLGDINEMMVDPSGKIAGYVIGVGGFLGMGEHSIIVEPSKLKFVFDSVTTTSSRAPGMTSRDVSNTTATTTANKPYPDHAVLSATKDQLKGMPQFRP